MAILYLVSKSPFESKDLRVVLEMGKLQKGFQEKVGIVAIQDAVLGVRKGQSSNVGHTIEDMIVNALSSNMCIYALAPDLLARAITFQDVIEGVKVVGYKGLIDLIMNEYDRIVSWT